MEQPERGLFAGLWGPLTPGVWPGYDTQVCLLALARQGGR